MQFQGGWVAVGIARSDSPSKFTQTHWHILLTTLALSQVM